MMWRFCTVLVVVIALLGAYLANEIHKTLGHGKTVVFNDDHCTLLQTPTAIEDVTAFGDGHAVFGGGGDIFNAFHHGSQAAEPGGVYLINATQETIRKLNIYSAIGLPKLILHGMFYSRSSQKLYAVNHDVSGRGSSVEIFRLKDTQSFDLEHLASVTSELFLPFSLNDVVEGADDSEFYVTQWVPFGFPAAGGKSPSNGLKEGLQTLAMIPINLLKIRMTTVYRCTVGAKSQCEVATPHKFVMANGIAISEDRKTVHISDPVVPAIVTLSRQASGSLEYVSEFKPPHGIDNLEVGPDGRLQGGSLPIVFASKMICDDGLGSEAVIDGRNVGCGRCPGGLLEMFAADSGHVTQNDVLMHDGSKLSMISAALKVGGNKVVLGSPVSPGALVCTL